MVAAFKEIEQKAFVVQENYKKTQEVFLEFIILTCTIHQFTKPLLGDYLPYIFLLNWLAISTAHWETPRCAGQS